MIFKRIFFTVIFACVFSCVAVDGFAGECGAGQYRYGSVCYDCHDGCFCLGGGNQIAGVMNCDATNQILKFGAIQKPDGFVGVHLCPTDYPKSPKGASKITDCRNSNANYRFSCGQEGKYLPPNALTCEDCPAGYYCPLEGGYMEAPYTGNPRGIYACDPGSFSTGGATDCTHCEGNKYQPNNGQQGCLSCSGTGKAVNLTHTDCVDCASISAVANKDHTECVVGCGTSKKLGTYVSGNVCYNCPSVNSYYEYVMPQDGKTTATSKNDCWIKYNKNDTGCEKADIYFQYNENKYVLSTKTTIKAKENQYVTNFLANLNGLSTFVNICKACGSYAYSSDVVFNYTGSGSQPESKEVSCHVCLAGKCIDGSAKCVTCPAGKICPEDNMFCDDTCPPSFQGCKFARTCEGNTIPDESRTKCEECPYGTAAKVRYGDAICTTGKNVFVNGVSNGQQWSWPDNIDQGGRTNIDWSVIKN